MNKILLLLVTLLFSVVSFAQTEDGSYTTKVASSTAVTTKVAETVTENEFKQRTFFNFQKEGTQAIVKAGLSTYQGDIHCRSDDAIGIFDALNGSFGFGFRIPVFKTVGLRAGAHYFRLSGDETQFDSKEHQLRGWKFTNNFLETAAVVDWEILGHRRFKDCKFRPTLTPVIFAGMGASFVNPDVDYGGVEPERANEDRENGEKVQLAIPIGVGLKYYLSDAFALGFEVGVRRPVSDYYDGVSLTANPDWDDGYGFGGFTASFRLGKKKDIDKDGFYNYCENCPYDPEKQEPGTCDCGKADVDTDGDGVADCKDKCPEDPNKTDPGSCDCGVADTDMDDDGTPDCIDECPEDPKKIKPGDCGCGMDDYADKDGDKTVDCKDGCPDDPNKTEPGKCGCGAVDTDGDGVCDPIDECPSVPGTLTRKGCPAPPPTPPLCNCGGDKSSMFNFKKQRSPVLRLTRLGTNPEFGNSHDLDPTGFYNKLKSRYQKSNRDREFLDKIFRGMGYSGFNEVTPDLFSSVELESGVTGYLGSSKKHKTVFATIVPTNKRDLQAFRIQGKAGCSSMHFMKTCGNHMFICDQAPGGSY